MQNQTRLYGIVEGYENISFVIEDFQCIFFHSDPQPKSPIILPQQQGFILGRTPERKYVYIYANQELKIWHELTLNTWTYFVSSFPDISTYKILCFENGILNKLFFPSSVIFEYTEKAETKVKYQDDSLTYTLAGKNVSGNISIHSTPHERRSAEKGDCQTQLFFKFFLGRHSCQVLSYPNISLIQFKQFNYFI